MAQVLRFAYGSQDLLLNGNFETGGVGPPADVFAAWEETAGDGSIVATTASGEYRTGKACKLTGGPTPAASPVVTQTVTVIPRLRYILRFWTRGDGTNAGRYYIYDVSNGSYIKALGTTGVTSWTYTAVQYAFDAPAGCTSVRIAFLCPNGNTQWACFDDATFTGPKTLALNSGPNAGFDVVARAWAGPRMPQSRPAELPDPVTETLPIQVERSTFDLVAADLQALAEVQENAAHYQQRAQETNPVWLHMQHTDETYERRALVYSIAFDFHDPEAAPWKSPRTPYLYRGTLQIRRGPWEATGPSAEATATGLSCLGGAFDYTLIPSTNVPGDIPGRIWKMTLEASSGSVAIDKAWFGFRSENRHGNLARFLPIWECELGSISTDASLAIDATASGSGTNTKVVVSFATVQTWADRVLLDLYNMTTDFAEQYGLYICLLRAHADSACVAQARIKYGNANSQVTRHIMDITAHNTNWYIFNMGLVNIPARNLRSLPIDLLSPDADEGFRITVQARRTSGSGNLHLDCVILIPVDEAWMQCQGLSIGGSSMYTAYYGESPMGEPEALIYGSVPGLQKTVTVTKGGGGLPVGDGRMYGVLARENDVHVLTDTWAATLSHIPRWLSLRGAE